MVQWVQNRTFIRERRREDTVSASESDSSATLLSRFAKEGGGGPSSWPTVTGYSSTALLKLAGSWAWQSDRSNMLVFDYSIKASLRLVL